MCPITSAIGSNTVELGLGAGLYGLEDDDGSESNGEEKGCGTPVVAGRNAAPVLETPKRDFDAVMKTLKERLLTSFMA